MCVRHAMTRGMLVMGSQLMSFLRGRSEKLSASWLFPSPQPVTSSSKISDLGCWEPYLREVEGQTDRQTQRHLHACAHMLSHFGVWLTGRK